MNTSINISELAMLTAQKFDLDNPVNTDLTRLISDALKKTYDAALEDASWQIHIWVVENALSGKLREMPPSNISCNLVDTLKKLIKHNPDLLKKYSEDIRIFENV